MRGKYGAGDDVYCWPGTTVLKNRLGIMDAATLEQAEAEFAAVAVQTIEITAPPFDAAYLQHLHRQLFADVYDWAGLFRTVDISKAGTRFCTATRIAPELAKALDLLDRPEVARLSRSRLVAHVAECYGEVNMVHPFREGNGRAQRLFFEHWLLAHGIGVSWERVHHDEWVAACIAAVACDYSGLAAIFDRCMAPI